MTQIITCNNYPYLEIKLSNNFIARFYLRSTDNTTMEPLENDKLVMIPYELHPGNITKIIYHPIYQYYFLSLNARKCMFIFYYPKIYQIKKNDKIITIDIEHDPISQLLLDYISYKLENVTIDNISYNINFSPKISFDILGDENIEIYKETSLRKLDVFFFFLLYNIKSSSDVYIPIGYIGDHDDMIYFVNNINFIYSSFISYDTLSDTNLGIYYTYIVKEYDEQLILALLNPNINIVCLPIAISYMWLNAVHSIAIIVNKQRKTVMLFDPWGGHTTYNQNVVVNNLLDILHIPTRIYNWRIYLPSEYMPYDAYQTMVESSSNKLGTCLLWTIWFLYSYVQHIDLSIELFISYSMDYITKKNPTKFIMNIYNKIMLNSVVYKHRITYIDTINFITNKFKQVTNAVILESIKKNIIVTPPLQPYFIFYHQLDKYEKKIEWILLKNCTYNGLHYVNYEDVNKVLSILNANIDMFLNCKYNMDIPIVNNLDIGKM